MHKGLFDFNNQWTSLIVKLANGLPVNTKLKPKVELWYFAIFKGCNDVTSFSFVVEIIQGSGWMEIFSPLTEENKDVELVELLVEARPLIVVKFIETVLTEPNQGICTFSFSDQIKGLPLYQPLWEWYEWIWI